MKRQMLLITLLYIFSMFAQASQPITVSDAYVRLLPTSVANTAAYMSLMNNTSTPLSIIAVKSSKVNQIEIHGHQMKDGVMAMIKYDSVTIEANSSLVFQPGGKHFMLLDIDKHYHDMKTIDFKLVFSDGSSVQINAAVGQPPEAVMKGSSAKKETPEQQHKHHHHH